MQYKFRNIFIHGQGHHPYILSHPKAPKIIVALERQEVAYDATHMEPK